MPELSVAYLIEYPVELTDKDWQKKKGLVAKTVKTGIKAELDKGSKLVAAIDTDKLSLSKNSPKTMTELENAVKSAKENFTTMVPPMIAQLKKIKETAETAEKLLTKEGYGDAAKAAAAIAKKAESFALTCKSVGFKEEYDKLKTRIEKRLDMMTKELAPAITKFRKGCMIYVTEDDSHDSWVKNVYQHGRSVSNAISVLADYKDIWALFQKFEGFDTGTLDLKEDTKEKKAMRAKIVAAALKLVEKIETRMKK